MVKRKFPVVWADPLIFNGAWTYDPNDWFSSHQTLEQVIFNQWYERSSGRVEITDSPIDYLIGAGIWQALVNGSRELTGAVASKMATKKAAKTGANAYSKYGFQALNHIDDVKGVSGLYLFDDATRGMLPYVGKSNVSIASRLTSHYNAGRIGGQIYFKPMTGSRTFLEVQETIMMNNLGGKLGTANSVFPVSPVRNLRLNLGITNH